MRARRRVPERSILQCRALSGPAADRRAGRTVHGRLGLPLGAVSRQRLRKAVQRHLYPRERGLMRERWLADVRLCRVRRRRLLLAASAPKRGMFGRTFGPGRLGFAVAAPWLADGRRPASRVVASPSKATTICGRHRTAGRANAIDEDERPRQGRVRHASFQAGTLMEATSGPTLCSVPCMGNA